MRLFFRRRGWSPNFSSGKTEKKKKRLEKIKLLVSLILPLSIGIFTIVTTLQSRHIAHDERLQEQQQADDEQREAIFVNYINDIARYRDRNSHALGDNNKLIYIRAKTLTALRKLDDERKKLVFLFLRDSTLLPQSNFTLLSGADFNRIELYRDDCVFTNTNFTGVQFRHVSFTECLFTNVTFVETSFNQARLTRSLFYNASFIRCDMSDVSFQNAIISVSQFHSSTLIHSNFQQGVLRNTTFSNVNLMNATLSLTDDDIVDFESSLLPNGTFSAVQPIHVPINLCSMFPDMFFAPKGAVEIENCTFITTVPDAQMYQGIPMPFTERSVLIDFNQAELYFQLRRNNSTANVSVIIFMFSTKNAAYKEHRFDCPTNAGLICDNHIPLIKYTDLAGIQISLTKKGTAIDQLSYTLQKISTN